MMGASEILLGLWQGGRPPTGRELAQRGFHVLVLAAEEYQPPAESFPGLHVMYAPFNDKNEEPSLRIKAVLDKLSRLLAWQVCSGRKVLVTCNMGWNRSGLLVGLIAWKLTGLPGSKVLRLVQAQRSYALGNRAFAAMIARLPPRKPICRRIGGR